MATCSIENRCVPIGGNGPDNGLCTDCEQQAIDAQEARAEEVRAALREFADQMPGQMWDYAVTATISALVRACSLDGRCRLCGRYNECAPGCAVEGLREVME
jgi:hypothetical protein